MTSRAARIARNIVGGVFALFGFLAVLAETWFGIFGRHDPNAIIVTIGAVAIFVGGYIMWPAGTEQIADSLQERIPLRFGRRNTDTSAVPKTVTITKSEPIASDNKESSLGGE